MKAKKPDLILKTQEVSRTIRDALNSALALAVDDPGIEMHTVFLDVFSELTYLIARSGYGNLPLPSMAKDIILGAKREIRREHRDKIKRNADHSCAKSLETGLFYDVDQDAFVSEVPKWYHMEQITKFFEASPHHVILNEDNVHQTDFTRHKLMGWLRGLPAFANDDWRSYSCAEALMTIDPTIDLSAVILVDKGRYNAFKAHVKDACGIPPGSFVNLTQGLVGVRDDKDAAILALMGYYPISFDEIRKRLPVVPV